MSRRRQERAALRALQRRVWGDAVYESHLADLTRRRQRRFGLVAIVAGAQLVVIAFALLMFANPASAHTSQITISCTQVQFNYSNFPGSTATAHESIVIDGQQGPQRDFVFGSSSATDVITIGPLGPGTHMIDASTHWSFD